MSFAAVPDLAQRSASARSGASAATGQADRFGLLLLDEGEYYFKGHTAYHWVEERKRWVAHGWWGRSPGQAHPLARRARGPPAANSRPCR
jgi:hypothetical protein